MTERYNIDEPCWDQRTFYGRLCHFASITDFRCVFVPTPTLYAAKDLLISYREQREPPETTIAALRRAQKLYGSAFHPDTGELQNIAGRMCFNVYGGTVLCAAMMIWYRSTPAVVFWQWSNQSFNALVNYTNRNAKSVISSRELLIAYGSAVSASLTVAIALKRHFAKQSASTLKQRLVPLAAVMVANAVNVPLMRQNELLHGIGVINEAGEHVGFSKLAAAKAISLVVISRNIMVAPSMILTPIIMENLEKLHWFRTRIRLLNIPIQTALTFVLFGAMVPVGCALFPQKKYLVLGDHLHFLSNSIYTIWYTLLINEYTKNTIRMTTLHRFEPSAYNDIHQKMTEILPTTQVYFNKGL